MNLPYLAIIPALPLAAVALSLLIGDRISVTVDGSGIDAGALKGALKEIDLSKLAALTASAR